MSKPDSSMTACRALFEGVPLDGHVSHPWIIDGDAVIECLLDVVDAVGILPQSGVRGQDDEAGGLDGRAERAEDPLRDQQSVQVRLTQGAFGQALEAFGDEVGEQAHPAAFGAHPLHGGSLPPQFRLLLGEGFLQPLQDARDTVSAVRTGGSHAGGEGITDVVQAIPASAILRIHSRRIMSSYP
ncbi:MULTISPECIES: hypothetical protein [Actinoalloteichus]|uniref:hypothetical protein n=1 Tax=Actinoalloteichus TaxID=65496 RepID=UPI001E5BBD0A|nr:MULTISPECIES: hypothetical protein [Actinoalloteichus]